MNFHSFLLVTLFVDLCVSAVSPIKVLRTVERDGKSIAFDFVVMDFQLFESVFSCESRVRFAEQSFNLNPIYEVYVKQASKRLETVIWKFYRRVTLALGAGEVFFRD